VESEVVVVVVLIVVDDVDVGEICIGDELVAGIENTEKHFSWNHHYTYC
jgi:hypothetical protein